MRFTTPRFFYTAFGGLIGLIFYFFPFVFTAHVDGGNVFAVLAGISTGISVIYNPRNVVLALIYYGVVAAIVIVKTALYDCVTLEGIVLFLMIPLSAMSFCAALATRIPIWTTNIRLTVFLGAWLLLALISFLVPFYTSPSVSYVSPVWGWWPGPIYDGAIRLDQSILFFFGSVFFIGLAFLLDFFYRKKGSRWAEMSIPFIVIAWSAWMEQSPTQSAFNENFPQTRDEKHVTVFTTRWIPEADLSFYADYANTQVADIRASLALLPSDTAEKIHVFIYADSWEKQTYTGAFETSYVPVWLKNPQVHITRQDFQSTIKHELVHAVLKPFGNALFGASWNPALIEGAAVALAPNPYARFSPDELVKNGNEPPERIKEMFSLTGFYIGRGGLSYTFAGSFLGFLIQNYPPEYFTASYARGNLEQFYKKPLDSLIIEWNRHLEALPADSTIGKQADRLFAQPSLMEKSCARTMSKTDAILDRTGWLEAKTLFVLADSLLIQLPETQQRIQLWMKHSELALKTGRKLVSFSDSGEIRIPLRNADWAMLYGEKADANSFLDEAKRLIRLDADSSAWMISTQWRFNEKQWMAVLHARYRHDKLTTENVENLPEEELFRLMYDATPGRAKELADRILPSLEAKHDSLSPVLRKEVGLFRQKAGLSPQ